MVSLLLVVAFLCMVILYALDYAYYRPKKFPPGPPRIPFFGTYLFFLIIDFNATHRVALLFSKWYKSKIIGFYLAKYLTVVVHSYEGVKEVLNRQEFDGRPDLFAGRLRDPQHNRKGPPRIPFFGTYLFFLFIDFKATFRVPLLFSKWYKSKTIGFYFGGLPTVVLHSQEGVKQVLMRPEFDGRPDSFAGRMRDPNYDRKGIFFNDGHVWKIQRRFILRYLRDFGFGRRFQELESFINEELLELLDILKDGPKYPHEKQFYKENQALCPYFMSPVMVNAFLKILCNERISRVDQDKIGTVAIATEEFQRKADDYGRMISLLPWIRHLFPKTSGYKELSESNAVVYKFIKAVIDRHLETFNSDHIRNFIDMYIDEMLKEQKQGGPTTFSVDQFVLGIVDFIFPAISAISTQLSFMFQWFLLKPEIQHRIQAEIDEVVGKGRLPTLDDRQNMHFTEASIRECLRLETLVPSNIPHRALVDTEILGYSIPANTIVLTGLYGFHHDKDVWGDPENFRPQRFLDGKGHFAVKKDISLPFGAGKRLCAGETFARNMLFLTLSTICQHFTIVQREGESLPDMSKTLCGLIRTPPDFWVQLEAR